MRRPSGPSTTGGGLHVRQLLLATGGAPRRLHSAAIISCTSGRWRTTAPPRAPPSAAADCRDPAAASSAARSAAGLAMNACDVTVVFPRRLWKPRVSSELALFLNGLYERRVRVWRSTGGGRDAPRRAPGVDCDDRRRRPERDPCRRSGRRNRDPAERRAGPVRGLEVDDGILVDELLRRLIPTSSRRGRRLVRQPRPGTRSGWSMRTTRTSWVGPQAARWPGAGSRITTCRSSTRTCSSSAMRRSADRRPLRGRRAWKTPTVREFSTTCRADGCGRAAVERLGQVDAARRLIAEPRSLPGGGLEGRLPAP